MYNKAIMIGNLTRDIELRYLQSGTAVAKTAIATTRTYTVNGEKKEETCFMDITIWGKAAETLNQYARKGSKLMVEGRIVFEQWVDQNQQKRSKHTLTVDEFKFLDSKADSERKAQNASNQGQQQGGYQQPQQQSYQAPQQGHQQAYQAPQQGQQQSYQAPQQGHQQAYQAPVPTYENQQGQQVSQESYSQNQQQNRPQQQASSMPDNGLIPEIDIDEDEIPF